MRRPLHLPPGPAERRTALRPAERAPPPPRGVPRYLGAAARPVALQRDGDGEPVSEHSSTFKMPPLAQPGEERWRSVMNHQLQLDPDLRAQMIALARARLDPTAARQAAAEALEGEGGTGTPDAVAATPTARPASASEPSRALDPDYVKTQRVATGGDMFNALLKTPAVGGLLDRLRSDAVGRLERDWSTSSTGENVAFVGGSVFVAGSLLTGVMSNPESRKLTLSLLNDTVIPIPKLDGLSVEFHIAGDGLQFGAHLDFGRFLPDLWGFGAGKPKAFNDPGWRAIPPPVDRDAEGAATTPAAALAGGIAAQHGGGAALGPGLRARFEPALGADLSAVRVHSGAQADALARSVQARAFTTGPDIFFRAGRLDPASASGQRLLAHEVVHTVQQANGPVDARPAGGGLRVSEPGDRHEQEARRLAERMVAPGRAAHGEKPAAAAPAIQRQPAGGAAPDNGAAALLAKAPPLWSDYFDELVPAIAEAAEANDKIGLQRALWLITQAYGEQSPGVSGLPSAHRNRLFNEQAAVTFKPDGAVDKVVPGQEGEGVRLKKLNQNEGAERGTTEMKVSPTFGYDTPERAVKHHLEQMAARWKPASDALLTDKGSFEGFAHALKDAHYAKAKDYDTGLISLKNQVRSQVEAWLPYTIAQRRQVRLPPLQVYAEQARAAAEMMAGSLGSVAGLFMVQLQVLQTLAELTERRLQAERAALARLERFAQVLGVKVPQSG